jgi:crossover junction endodeoxyribonuclease RuvC
MIVLGIDPGLARTGFGVVAADGSRVRLLAQGAVTTAAGLDTGTRLASIAAAVGELVERHRPDAVAVESLYVGANPRAILAVGQARGAALAACGRSGVPSAEYSPAQVKTAVCGYGRAEKGQVGRMVAAILGLAAAPASEHAADALAVAICHLAASRVAIPAGGRR